MMKEEIEIPYEVEEASQKLVLMYFQHWGQKVEDRINALNAVVALAGIKAEFFQEMPAIPGHQVISQIKSGWRALNEGEALRAKKFREELDKCFPLGRFEDERDAVSKLIMKTRGEI